MVDVRSTVVAVVLRADAGRRTISQAILVGSSRDRVAIQRRPGRERGRGKRTSAI